MPSIALYVHLPFCEHRCSYCDFNAFAGLDHLIGPYVRALRTELALWAPHFAGFRVRSVYFGGGTPSRVPPELIGDILADVREEYRLARNAEITTEANPSSAEAARFHELRRLGITRISIGAQSFHDDELHVLERTHSAAEAEAAVRAAADAGFANVSVDLMFGLPGQDLQRWRENLERALSLPIAHLSCYALTVEEATPLAARVRSGRVAPPDDDLQAEMWDEADHVAGSAGLRRYEISNWARPGHECRHNLVYWRAEPYLGVGAGAHGYAFGVRFADEPSPQRYIAALAADHRAERLAPGLPLAMPQVARWERQPPDREAADALWLGLRRARGVDTHEYARRFGRAALARFVEDFAECEALGLLAREGCWIRLTRRGTLLANEVLSRFVAPDPEPRARLQGSPA